MPAPRRFVADGWWPGGSGSAVVEVEGGAVRRVVRPADGLPRLRASVLPGVVDRHVHLGLIDGSALAASPVVEVHDLGWIPDVAAQWSREPHTGGAIHVAGALITSPGGYPVGHGWAPDGAIRPIDSPAAAASAVGEALARGQRAIKVALSARQNPLDEATLTALVDAAHEAGLTVIAHAQGARQPARAVAAGVDALAHVPWTEHLADDLLAEAARRTTWISTLAIHGPLGRVRALGNARRFVAAGGRLVYGTDAGNGDWPPGVRGREVELLARVLTTVDGLLAALTGIGEGGTIPLERAIVADGPVPAVAAHVPDWIAGARRLTDVLDNEEI